jgi:2-polyprenyl-6-methoxyphenol hydroxylase-like FAD-dependent oxidoreductase
MYAVIVVGARCAGAATALLLARRGHRVLLVDRATFPSNIPHGHFIHRHGPTRLRRWELLDQVIATGCPPSRSFTLRHACKHCWAGRARRSESGVGAALLWGAPAVETAG